MAAVSGRALVFLSKRPLRGEVMDIFDQTFAITRILLKTEAEVPGMDADAFQEQAEAAKSGCPVSKVLAGPRIELEATLKS